ncbi:MAG: polyphosphate kinase 1, partial [Eubacteriales bacterium]|nr:polyphosphate kinase 1 [Eubacteriales bacterium]
SPIVAALAQAAEAGKQVTVLLEIKARFDEENNIQWGKCLEQAGCHVVYGLVGLKTHSKITLVVRREGGNICRYIHLATGNYNDVTAKVYTDMGILSVNHDLCEDGGNFFNMLTGYCDTPEMKRLIYAPHQLRDGVLRCIRRETENARRGLKAAIDAKMNSLVDEEVIAALYEASRAGVKIRLMVRGICCLRPHVPDLSENIEVRSIVGRFLEHARIFYFENNGDSQLYLSSADWMNRNLDRRVELMFPVLDADVRDKVLSILRLQFRDNAKAWTMFEDGHYERVRIAEGEEKFNSQEYLAAMASRAAEEQ